MTRNNQSDKCCSSRRCNVVYVDPKYGNNCSGRLQDLKCAFKTYSAAVKAILENPDEPSQFNRWLVKLSNCTFNEDITLYSWIDIEGESRQGTIIEGQIIAGNELAINTENYTANLTVHPPDSSAVYFDTEGSSLFNNVRLLRTVTTTSENDNYLVEILSGNLTIVDSIATLISGSAPKIAMYAISGDGLVDLIIRNTRHTLTITDYTDTEISYIQHQNSNPNTSILSKVNTFEGSFPDIHVIYNHLLSIQAGGKLSSHHDSIRFSFVDRYSILLINLGPSFQLPSDTTEFFGLLTKQITVGRVDLIEATQEGSTVRLDNNIPFNDLLFSINWTAPNSATRSAAIKPQDSIGWSATVIDGQVNITLSPIPSLFRLIHSVGSGIGEMIDADIRGLPTDYQITIADGINAVAIAHNLRIHDVQVLTPPMSINGGTALQTELVTDGMHLIGGQEASKIRKLDGNNQFYTFENDVTAVIVTGQGNIITLPPITPSLNEDRQGTKLILKNGGEGAVGVTTTDGALIDTITAATLAPFGALTLLASSNPNIWNIITQNPGNVPPYPFDYAGQGFTNIEYINFTGPGVLTVVPSSIIAFTIVGGGGGAFARSEFGLGGGAGGGGAAIQLAFDGDELLAFGITQIVIEQVGQGGINTSEGATDATPSIISYTYGTGLQKVYTAWNGGSGGISTFAENLGGGGGGGAGGPGQRGSNGGQGGIPLDGLGPGGQGGFANGLQQLVPGGPAVQVFIPNDEPIFYNQQYYILYTPGSGGGIWESGVTISNLNSGGQLSLINGATFTVTGYSGGISLGAYPVGPIGLGAMEQATIPPPPTPANIGGGGIFDPSTNVSFNGGPGFVNVQIVSLT